MIQDPAGETRGVRAHLTKRALADVVRRRMATRRLRQTDVARWSGLSRSFIQSVLRAEQDGSFFLFLELSRGLGVDDACDLLREVLKRRDALRAARASLED